MNNPDNDYEDLINYKGEFYGKETEKYQDPITGAHFRYEEVFKKLKCIKEELEITNYNSMDLQATPLQVVRSNKLKITKNRNQHKFLFKSQENPCISEVLNNKIPPKKQFRQNYLVRKIRIRL